MQVRRSGYGAMQLVGPYAFGPPPDRAAAIGVLRAAVAAGVDYIDTAQYYGPGVVNDPDTVNAHIRRIYAKLQVRDRSSAVQRARELRLLATGRALARR
jgi:aryl-alcohol dehydrogenase-like predicted oxidoreductase